jgi:hypothetical protein
LIWTHTLGTPFWVSGAGLIYTHTLAVTFAGAVFVWSREFANVTRCGLRFNSLLHDYTNFWIPTSPTTHNTNMSDNEPKPADEVMAAGEEETNEEVCSHPSHQYTQNDRS